jgi:hypothetical protein
VRRMPRTVPGAATLSSPRRAVALLVPLLVVAIGGAVPANAAPGEERAPGTLLGLPVAFVAAFAVVVGILVAGALVKGRARARRPARPGHRVPHPGVPPRQPGPGLQPMPPFQPGQTGEHGQTGEPQGRTGEPATPVPQDRRSPGDRTVEPAAPGNGKPAARPSDNERSRPQHQWWEREWQTVKPAGAAGTAATYPAEPAAAEPAAEPGAASEPGAAPAGVWESQTPRPRRPHPRSELLLCGSCGQANPLTNSYCEQCWGVLSG